MTWREVQMEQPIQPSLFGDSEEYNGTRRYRSFLSAVENKKGVLDVDTVKGCTCGMRAYPGDGCYGECYAAKTAARYGIDFSISVSRKMTHKIWRDIFCIVKNHHTSWYRIGTAGEPCNDWENTIQVCEALRKTQKTPVIITKHWIPLSDDQAQRLQRVSAVINTSCSGLDSDSEIRHRVLQIERVRAFGIRSVCRVVTCRFGDSEWARSAHEKQRFLLSLLPVIDNPLRARKSNSRVENGDIILTRRDESVGGGKFVSLHSKSAYLGTCDFCPDQCGAPCSSSTSQRGN
jgi:hypothetical protein